MNQGKLEQPTKTLVRNTSRPLPKTRVVLEDKEIVPSQKPTYQNERPTDTFGAPRLQTALRIPKSIEKMSSSKLKSFNTCGIAYSEKLTRKINFPTDKAIYKDLIPLDVPGRSTPVLTSREPLPQKDKEPMLESFIKIKPQKEYIYKPSIKLEKRVILPKVNNLHLYKIMME